MKKIVDMLGVSRDDAQRGIWLNYKKGLTDKLTFWDRGTQKNKMEFSFIPAHDNRISFWLFRKGDKLVVQGYAFKYQYSVNWQLIFNKVLKIKTVGRAFDIVDLDNKLRGIFNDFLDMKCKDSPDERR